MQYDYSNTKFKDNVITAAPEILLIFVAKFGTQTF